MNTLNMAAKPKSIQIERYSLSKSTATHKAQNPNPPVTVVNHSSGKEDCKLVSVTTLTRDDVEHGEASEGGGGSLKQERRQVHGGNDGHSIRHEQREHILQPLSGVGIDAT